MQSRLTCKYARLWKHDSFSLRRITSNFIEKKGDQNKIPFLENETYLNYLRKRKIISKGPNCTSNRNIKLLMESSNVSNFTCSHTPYCHKDLKEKMYFKKTQVTLLLPLKYFSCWVCFLGEEPKKHQQKQLRNFAEKLILYFQSHLASPPTIVSEYAYIFIRTYTLPFQGKVESKFTFLK